MNRYVYTVWFRDLTLANFEEGYEWPACFLIEAPSPDDAHSWGDHLANSYTKRKQAELFLKSGIEEAGDAKGDLSTLPLVLVGKTATDAELGW